MMRTWVCFAALTVICFFVPLGAFGQEAVSTDPQERPNILWITAEDHGPQLGCYGDTFATTPHLDELAARGMLFLHAWSNAPVCAPARTAIITGMYPTSLGAEHMRSRVPLPRGVQLFPDILRENGYYCTNNAKEDYNVAAPSNPWDESSRRAHWRIRPAGKPFFAVFNFTISHESQIRARPHRAIHDPAGVRVPAYHPDTPETRQDWAQYYDKITEVDTEVGRVLGELDQDGLAGDTIVFFYADHGSGMPRCKRWPYNSGLHVPVIVYFPEKWRHLAPREYQSGSKSDRLVSFVDLAPTVLSLIGVESPSWMLGHAFAGAFQTDGPQFAFGFRGRMDERYDLVRSVTDGRYVYIRNFMPHLPYGQHLEYMFQTPTTRVWKEAFDRGELNDAQSAFWRRKPSEELYDLQADPDETKNLIGSDEQRPRIEEFRRALREWIVRVRDVGLVPESEMRRMAGSGSPYDLARETGAYNTEKILTAAETATGGPPADAGTLSALLTDPAPGVRYWGAIGFLNQGKTLAAQTADNLEAVLNDESPCVRIAAAEALAEFADESSSQRGFDALLKVISSDPNQGVAMFLEALNALDRLVDSGIPRERIEEVIEHVPDTHPAWDPRANYGVARLKQHIRDTLGASSP